MEAASNLQTCRVKAATHGLIFGEEKNSMKIKNVFDQIFSMENLYGALEDASRGRRYKRDVLYANLNSWEMLDEIRQEIYGGTYSIDEYFIFYVYEPKKRMIMSIRFKHRIVQWAIYRVLNPMLVKGYIRDTYGCIPERGNLRAMQRLKYWLEQADRNGKKKQWYYLKLDISKYFYRISHRVLKEILAKKIKDRRLLNVLYAIIDCRHTPFGLPPGKGPGDVPMEERLYDVGMPVGNLMSQMFANVCLDVLDQFCKRELGIHRYIRCMDDVIILDDNKKQLREWKDRIGAFLNEKLELQLNQKTCIRPVNQGIEFVGYRIWPGRVVVRKSTTLRIKRKLKGIRMQYAECRITLACAASVFVSYIGMLMHTDSSKLIAKMYAGMVLTHAEDGGTGGSECRQNELVPMLPQIQICRTLLPGT